MTEGALVWLFLATMALFGYAVACSLWPWSLCRRCKGKKSLRSPTGRYHRDCPSCAGKGRKLRWGRRVLTVARR